MAMAKARKWTEADTEKLVCAIARAHAQMQDEWILDWLKALGDRVADLENRADAMTKDDQRRPKTLKGMRIRVRHGAPIGTQA